MGKILILLLDPSMMKTTSMKRRRMKMTRRRKVRSPREEMSALIELILLMFGNFGLIYPLTDNFNNSFKNFNKYMSQHT